MKITHIHIERFRGFQNEDFEVGSLLTAIAGQNGTQKSTLLGIITQTFTLKTEDSMRVEKPLCGGSYISAFKDKFRLSPTFDKPKGHEWNISIDFRLPSPANHQSTITLHFSIRHIQEARNAISKLDMLFYCTQT